jgi:hypothetical protein
MGVSLDLVIEKTEKGYEGRIVDFDYNFGMEEPPIIFENKPHYSINPIYMYFPKTLDDEVKLLNFIYINAQKTSPGISRLMEDMLGVSNTDFGLNLGLVTIEFTRECFVEWRKQHNIVGYMDRIRGQ